MRILVIWVLKAMTQRTHPSVYNYKSVIKPELESCVVYKFIQCIKNFFRQFSFITNKSWFSLFGIMTMMFLKVAFHTPCSYIYISLKCLIKKQKKFWVKGYLTTTARPNKFWCRNIRPILFSLATYTYVENRLNLKRYEIFSEQLCTLWLTFWCFWYITKIDMVYF